MMEVTEMRHAVRANRHWNALQALEAISGFEPTSNQIGQANSKVRGGLDDPDTILRIPEQIVAIRQFLWATYPGMIFNEQDTWAAVSLWRADQRSLDTIAQNSPLAVLSQATRKELGRVRFTGVDEITGIYHEELLRDPDPAGYAF